MIDPAPAGISTEPCVDGDTADLPLEYDLTFAEGLVAFAQTSTWRVPTTQCPHLGAREKRQGCARQK